MSDAPSARRTDRISFSGTTPILRVADFEASVEHYTRVLGFELAWSVGPFGSVRRGDAALMLCEGSQGHPGTWVYVDVSDSDALHEELAARGARIRVPPTNYPWGRRELHVFDLDGHVLRLGAPARPGDPIGEWLDEDGVRWAPRPDGGWDRVE